MAMAQAPESAGYDAMPHNAIATGLVDYVLAPAELPAQLLAYAIRAFAPATTARGAVGGRRLTCIIVLLRDRTGHDFSAYKRSTIRRRVERRMVVTQAESHGGLRSRPAAPTRSRPRPCSGNCSSASPTSFATPTAFEALATQLVIPEMVAARPAGDPVRVWVPAAPRARRRIPSRSSCRSTPRRSRPRAVQVFATDIDTDGRRARARRLYPDSIAGDVSPERLARFFAQDGTATGSSKSIRDLVVFAEQDSSRIRPSRTST